jgi:hypothetical protein
MGVEAAMSQADLFHDVGDARAVVPASPGCAGGGLDDPFVGGFLAAWGDQPGGGSAHMMSIIWNWRGERKGGRAAQSFGQGPPPTAHSLNFAMNTSRGTGIAARSPPGFHPQATSLSSPSTPLTGRSTTTLPISIWERLLAMPVPVGVGRVSEVSWDPSRPGVKGTWHFGSEPELHFNVGTEENDRTKLRLDGWVFWVDARTISPNTMSGTWEAGVHVVNQVQGWCAVKRPV